MPTVCELKIKAKELGLRGISHLRKTDLQNALEKFMNTPVRVKRPLTQRKHFKAGLAKTKEALAKGVVKSAVERAIAKYKANKEAEKNKTAERKYYERTSREQRLRDLISQAEQEAYGRMG